MKTAVLCLFALLAVFHVSDSTRDNDDNDDNVPVLILNLDGVCDNAMAGLRDGITAGLEVGRADFLANKPRDSSAAREAGLPRAASAAMQGHERCYAQNSEAVFDFAYDIGYDAAQQEAATNAASAAAPDNAANRG